MEWLKKLLGKKEVKVEIAKPPKKIVPKKVLLVEDTPANYEVGLRVLRSFGFDVDLASTYGEAKQKIGEGYFDFIILDVMLPRKDASRAEIAVIEELIKDPQLAEFSRFGTIEEEELKTLLDSQLLPLGILLMKGCIERGVKFSIATDVDHHRGWGVPAAAVVRLMAKKMGTRVNLLTPSSGKEKEFKTSDFIWGYIIKMI